MTPWLADPDVTLYHGDVLDVLRELPAELVDCCVTSPPYWGLRDYGTAGWQGGEESCDHRIPLGDGAERWDSSDTHERPFRTGENYTHQRVAKDKCPKCGATRIDQQLGLEPTPEEYVTRMVEVFREVRRVLAAHGTVWLNLGDSYISNGFWADAPSCTENVSGMTRQRKSMAQRGPGVTKAQGLKTKDLCGIPWRVAFALQADGWYLRSDIIWAKPNPMPESVTDRPTKAHEYVFLLSKQPRYFFDQEAVRERLEHPNRSGTNPSLAAHTQPGNTFQIRPGERNGIDSNPSGRNIRSVWEIATQPYPEAHFATFPEELARRCIAAGCPEQVCRVCGKARERVVETTYVPHGASAKSGGDFAGGERTSGDLSHGKFRPQEMKHGRATRVDTTAGFTDCGHSDYRPGTVLDPFMGSGTVAYVARKLGRHAVGIDLNESYLELAARRLQQQSLFAEVAS